jgi:hypothetical protein
MAAQYLPETPYLWRPGLSARLEGSGASTRWVVPRDGTYRLLASPALAAHPWFKAPFAYFQFRGPAEPAFLLDPARPVVPAPGLAWSLDGKPVVNAGELVLAKGSTLEVRNHSGTAMGIFLLPTDLPARFQGNPGGMDLDTDLFRLWKTE